jgi:hypothetical protein
VGVLAYALPPYTKPETHRTSIQFSSIQADSSAKTWGILLSYDAREALQRALAAGPVRARVMTQSRLARSVRAHRHRRRARVRPPNERFVFSAHVQEPGANDNASGVGAQVEMARVAATLVAAAR